MCILVRNLLLMGQDRLEVGGTKVCEYDIAIVNRATFSAFQENVFRLDVLMPAIEISILMR